MIVAEWRFESADPKDKARGWIFIEINPQETTPMQVWVDGEDGVNIFEITGKPLGQMMMERWITKSLPKLDRSRPPETITISDWNRELGRPESAD